MRFIEENEQRIFKSLQYLRLDAELKQVERELNQNMPRQSKEEDGVINKAWNKIQNVFYYDAVSEDLIKQKEKIEESIKAFNEKNPGFEDKRFGRFELRCEITERYGTEE